MVLQLSMLAIRRSLLRRWLAVLLLGSTFYIIYQMISAAQLTLFKIRYNYVQPRRIQHGHQSSTKQACRQPDLDPNDPVMKKFFGPAKRISCDEEPNWVYLEPGYAVVCRQAIERHNGVNCTYTFLERKSEFLVEEGQTIKGGDNPVKLQSDYFLVHCLGGDERKWSNIMVGVRSDPVIRERIAARNLPTDALGLNVLMWGHDSLSRMAFMRTLPKTYNYLTKILNAIVLKGYNIVGDGTPQALIPIFTGKTEYELPETRKRMKFANFVNIYPFIWNNFRDSGYVTAHAEDLTDIGTFTYRLKGFNEQPTDHYLRPFYMTVSKQRKSHKNFCLRATPRHKVLMNWVLQYFAMYPRNPKFGFFFHSEMSHDYISEISAIDDDLRDFLQQLHLDGYLNKTVLIVMSDHGNRFAKTRETQQGKQEERLPMFSFVFPPWFEKKYAAAMANFRMNAERLTTPFDIYPTLYNILHFEGPGMGNVSERGISLFKEIPLSRTCADADIEPHWCACLKWEEVDVDDRAVKKAALELVKHINNLTKSERQLCEKLELDQIVWAGKYLPEINLLKYLKNSDRDGFRADLSDHTSVSVEIYQVKIHTKPGEGHYEASLKYNFADRSFHLKTSDISRVNKYGKQAACIENTLHHLRKFCYCK